MSWLPFVSGDGGEFRRALFECKGTWGCLGNENNWEHFLTCRKTAEKCNVSTLGKNQQEHCLCDV